MSTIQQTSSLRERFRKTPFADILDNPVGWAILILLSIGLGYVSVHGGIVTGLLILVAMVAIPVVYAVVVYPLFGIAIMLSMGFGLFFIIRLGINFPLGTMMDGLQAMLILGFFIKQKTHTNWAIFRTPLSAIILIWIGYNMLEVINPWAESRLAWVYTVRSVAVSTLTYFVFVYQLKTIKSIRIVIAVWLFMAFLGALYGYKQEFIGIDPGELAYLESDPLLINLLFINGSWRKYSIFADPVAFSYNMVISSLLCIALIAGPFSKTTKSLLAFLALFMLGAMMYSGTRAAYVLVPAALSLYALLNMSKRILLFSVVAGFIIAIMIFIPTSNPTLYRFQTAFRPSEDASFNVRKDNQKRIQPYIITHPVGGGLGATGVWGVRFAPNSYLASFPPDSGYVRVAVEMGWIGLILFCTLIFIILKTGIQNFFKIHNPELKAYCLAMTLVVFALNIGNYPQEALVQFPNNILFYLAAALIHLTAYLDDEEQIKLMEQES